MLTTKEIKQAVERFKPDGFEILKDAMHFTQKCNDGRSIGYWCLLRDLENPLYDLFLDRCIQAVNRNTGFFIHSIFNEYDIEHDYIQDIDESFKHNGTTEGIREAREKAIRFVLSEIL